VTERVPRIRREEVRRRLIAAASELFATRGIDATSLEDIARAAGFTKGAVFSNFATKDELIAAILDERVSRSITDVTTALDSEDGRAAFSTVAGRTLAQITRSGNTNSMLVLEYLIRAARDPQVAGAVGPRRRAQRERIAGLIREYATERGLVFSLPPEVLALAIMALTNGIAVEHLADPEGVDIGAMEQIVAVLLPG
jgi:AcrR family transcriptional regulator